MSKDGALYYAFAAIGCFAFEIWWRRAMKMSESTAKRLLESSEFEVRQNENSTLALILIGIRVQVLLLGLLLWRIW